MKKGIFYCDILIWKTKEGRIYLIKLLIAIIL